MTQTIQLKLNGDSDFKKDMQDLINRLAGVDVVKKEKELDPSVAQVSFMTYNNANLSKVADKSQELTT